MKTKIIWTENRHTPTSLIVVLLIGENHVRGTIVDIVVIVVFYLGHKCRNESSETISDEDYLTPIVVHAMVRCIGGMVVETSKVSMRLQYCCGSQSSCDHNIHSHKHFIVNLYS
jgi:hypothetical protein